MSTCNQSFMDAPSSALMDASLAALFIEPRLPLPPDDDESPEELKNLLFRATMDMESSRAQYECELHHLKHLLRTTMQERDEAREEALKLRECFMSSGLPLSEHKIALPSSCPLNEDGFDSHILTDHHIDNNLHIQNNSSKASSSPTGNHDQQQHNMQLDSCISSSIMLNMDVSRTHLSDLHWELQDLPELELIPNTFNMIGEALSSEHETTFDSQCPAPQWPSIIEDTMQQQQQQQQLQLYSQNDTQFSSDQLHSEGKPNLMFSELFLNDYMRELSATFPCDDDHHVNVNSMNTLATEDEMVLVEKKKNITKKKHLPEPPEADPEVMLRSLPERGKLLQAVMKAGPLLETLLVNAPWRQYSSSMVLRPPPPPTLQETMENNPPSIMPNVAIPPPSSSNVPLPRVPMADICNDMSRFSNTMNVLQGKSHRVLSSHPSSMLLCNKPMSSSNNNSSSNHNSYGSSQTLLNTSANLSYSNRLLRSSALLPKRLVFNRSDIRLHH